MAGIYQLDGQIRKVAKFRHMLANNWSYYKFRFRIREALLRTHLEKNMQVWQKIAMTSKLISKDDKNEIMYSTEKLVNHPDILKRNTEQFAQMI